MPQTTEQSPFHRGEHAVQERVGVRERSEMIGQRTIRDHMPEQHREFYRQLPFVFIGAVDRAARPWASILVGRPGFIHSSDPRSLEIDAPMIDGDPLAGQLECGAAVGLLGIEYETRRRNRLSAQVVEAKRNGLSLKIVQTFGNCPQYIQARGFSLLEGIDLIGEPLETESFTTIDHRNGELIGAADNFYIATHHADAQDAASNGADVSHRGGNPGFVQISDACTLQFPDYAGNKHFNTLGNIALNPRAGLTFIDFTSGDLLYLTGRAEVIWDGPEVDAIDGAERVVRFTLEEGRRVAQAVPIRWDFLGYSPRLTRLGS